jgi:hypothetical protein
VAEADNQLPPLFVTGVGMLNVITPAVLLVRVTWAEGFARLKDAAVELAVSVPPPVVEPYEYETLMVPVIAGLVEVSVTAAVYVWPDTIPAVWTTEKYRVVPVVPVFIVPVTPSQFGPG